MIIDIPDIDVLQAGVTKTHTPNCQDQYKITPPINLDKFIFTRTTSFTTKHNLEYKNLYSNRGKVYYEDSYGGHWIYPRAMTGLFYGNIDVTKIVIHSLPCGDNDWSNMCAVSIHLTAFEVLCSTSQVINMNSAWNDCIALTSFPLIDTSNVTSMSRAWYGCEGLTSFPPINTSKVTDIHLTWAECTRLASFPPIDTSKVTSVYGTWNHCCALTSFPFINTSNVTDMSWAWAECTKLTSFPPIDTSMVTNMYATWWCCTSLTSFPFIDTNNVTNMNFAWTRGYSLTSFPHIATCYNIYATWDWCDSLPKDSEGYSLFDDGTRIPIYSGR